MLEVGRDGQLCELAARVPPERFALVLHLFKFDRVAPGHYAHPDGQHELRNPRTSVPVVDCIADAARCMRRTIWQCLGIEPLPGADGEADVRADEGCGLGPWGETDGEG